MEVCRSSAKEWDVVMSDNWPEKYDREVRERAEEERRDENGRVDDHTRRRVKTTE